MTDSAQTQGALITLQSVIERHIVELERLNEVKKSYRESLNNILSNDSELSEAQEQAAQITQRVKVRKSQLNASQEVNQIKANISEISERKKEIEESLNGHLISLFQMTGSRIVDLSSGTKEFRIKATLMGKS